MKLFRRSAVLSTEDTDDLVRKVTQGDVVAFEQIFNLHKGPILNFLNSMVKNQRLAEELAQDTFLKAYRYRESFQGHGQQYKSWLWTLARNSAIDYLRKHTEYSLDAMEDEGEGKSEMYLIDRDQMAVDEKIIQHTSIAEIQKVMNTLPLQQQEALKLRILSELSYEEVATVMKMTVAKVKTLIHRGRNSLKVGLQGDHL